MQRTSIGKRILIYASATAVLAFTAFTPLVSCAQANGKDAASAPLPARGGKGKAIPLSDAQKSAAWRAAPAFAGKENPAPSQSAQGGIGPSSQKYDSTHQYAGVRRILIELAASPDSAQAYAGKYAALVDEIAASLQDSVGGGGLAENRLILEALWKIMQSRFGFADDTKFISNSLLANAWDCDNSSSVAYDVLRKLGFSPEAIILSGHFLLKNQGLDLETRTGEIYPHDSIGFHYPSAPGVTQSINSLVAYGYFELGNRDSDSSQYERAVGSYLQAISLNHSDPNFHNNLGWAYECLGRYNEALGEYSISISLSPARGIARLNRANLYGKLGRISEASADREAYYGVKGINVLGH